ncbi:MAG: tRNA nucleotidyltransferase/poly(A) polymerase family protein [Candidatus Geothermincolia bacterium]
MQVPSRIDRAWLEAFDPFITEALELLAERGGVHLVGGYVRDLLLERRSRDADLVIEADPAGAASRLAERFGADLVVLGGERKLYRVVGAGVEGRVFDLSALEGADIMEDLAARDFTVNALGLDVGRLMRAGVRIPADLADRNGYGWQDLAAGVLRECGSRSFLEDPVRVLRAYRFAALLGFTIEERTLNHLKKYAPLLMRAPGERLATELLETLSYPDSARAVAAMERDGVLRCLFPAVAIMRGVEQNAYHDLDVWEHTLVALKGLEQLMEQPERISREWASELAAHLAETLHGGYQRSVFLKLAALFHDTGKPWTQSSDAGGRIHFYNHQRRSEEEAELAVRTLKLSNRAGACVTRTIGLHMDIGFLAGERPSARAVNRLIERLGEHAVDVIFVSVADRMATRGPLSTEADFEAYVEFCRELLEMINKGKELPRLIGGRELMEELGVEPGVALGDLLEQVRLAQLEGTVRTADEAVRFARELVSPVSSECRWPANR